MFLKPANPDMENGVTKFQKCPMKRLNLHHKLETGKDTTI